MMDNEKAAKILGCLGWGYTDGEIKEAVQLAQQALRENEHPQEEPAPKITIPVSDEYNFEKTPLSEMTPEQAIHELRDIRERLKTKVEPGHWIIPVVYTRALDMAEEALRKEGK